MKQGSNMSYLNLSIQDIDRVFLPYFCAAEKIKHKNFKTVWLDKIERWDWIKLIWDPNNVKRKRSEKVY